LDEADQEVAEIEVPGEEAATEEPKKDVDSAVSGFEDLEFSFDDSQLDLASGSSPSGGGVAGSGIDLSADALDDDDLVLGGSGTGSDLTLGGDSGISLIDPTDSGLSLEEPLDLADGSSDSLALSGDSMLSLDDLDTEGSAVGSASDSDFTLTPMDEVLDEDAGQSDSQVIALDGAESDELETIDVTSDMLDDQQPIDLGEASGLALEEAEQAAPLAEVGAVDFGAAVTQESLAPQPETAGVATVMTEAPYSGLNIASLGICCFLLVLVGMMMYDVMQNMWSWNGVHPFNSPLLDFLHSMLG
jgi:hypothetical protein